MADKVQLDVEVGGVEQSIKSVKELKQALKDAKDAQVQAANAFGEGSKEYVEATKNVSKLKDKVEDLNDSTKSLKGSGVERAAEGFNQLGDGLRNLDFDKVKTGLIAMKSALAAVGIGLVVQLVSYLIENFDKLSTGSGLLAKTLRGVGDIIGYCVDKISEFTDYLGLTNSALDKQGDAIKNNADKAKEGIASQTAEYDRQIAVAKASGKSAIDLEIAKQKYIIATNKALVEQTIAYVRNGGELNEEKKKLLNEQLDAIKGAVNDEKIIIATHHSEQIEKAKKHSEDLKKIENDRNEEFSKRLQQKIDNDKINRDNELKAEENAIAAKKLAEEDWKSYATEVSNEAVTNAVTEEQIKEAVRKLARQKNLEDFKKDQQQQFEITKQGIQGLQNLSDIFFSFKSSRLKKGSSEEIESAKKQFEINKALQLSTAVVSGFQSVQGAFTSATASPITTFFPAYPFVQAGLAGVFSAANIAKIASSQFSASSGTGSVATSAPNIAPTPQPPTNNSQNSNQNNSTEFDSNGNKVSQNNSTEIKVKAYVVETEMTDMQDKMKFLKQQSTF